MIPVLRSGSVAKIRASKNLQIDPMDPYSQVYFSIVFQTMAWKDYAAVTEREEEEVEVKEYGALVGEVLAKRMLLFRPGKS